MRLEVVIEKKIAFIIISSLFILASVLFVKAYGGTNPSVIGHSLGEIQGLPASGFPNCAAGQFLRQVGGAWSCASPSSTTFSCSEASRTNNNPIVLISGDINAFSSYGIGSNTAEVQWGLTCKDGYIKTGCSMSLGGAGSSDLYAISTSTGNGCATDNEEFQQIATVYLTCCKLS